MSLGKVFYIYMVIAGLGAGLLLVLAPQTQQFFIKPYFWMLIAVAVFDVACLIRNRGMAAGMLGMDVRLIGFVIGVVLLVVVPKIAGAPVTFF